MTAIFTCLLIELILQALCLLVPTIDFTLGPSPEYMKPGESVRWRGNARAPDHDSNGFRNRTVLASPDIVVLGDSHSYGSGVSRSSAWPMVLARSSGKSVYNMALPGLGPADAWVLVQEAIELQPDVIVFAFYAGNDLYDAWRQVRRDGKCTELADLTQLSRNGPVVDVPQVGFVDPDYSASQLGYQLAHYSKLVALIRSVLRTGRDSLRGRWTRYLREATAMGEPFDVVEMSSTRTILMPKRRVQTLDQSQVPVAEGLRITLTAIKDMHRQAGEAGIPLLVVLIPTKESVYSMYSQEGSDTWREVISLESVVREQLTSELNMAGIPAVDPLPALRERLLQGPQPYPESFNSHPSEAGHQVIAEVAREFLDFRSLTP